MLDWLKNRLSPVKKDTTRWKDLAEAIQDMWAECFDVDFSAAANLRSIYAADTAGQKRIAVEMGHYFEDGIADDNIPVSIGMRQMEIHQKETDAPLVRAMARIGFEGEWAPLYAPRREVYGTALYTVDHLTEHGYSLDADQIRLDGTWKVGEEPPVKLANLGVFLTSRGRMVLDMPSVGNSEMIDTARRRIMQVKPLHIVFDAFQYRWDMEMVLLAGQSLSQTPTHMAFGDGGHNPDGTPKTYNPDQTELQNELLRIDVTSATVQEDQDSLICTGTVEKVNLVDYQLSEAGLFDEDNNLLGYTNFTLTKIKENDEVYEVSMTLVEGE